MEIIISQKSFKRDTEVIERKGAGHPDTLADGLAETLSINFSNYSLERFGAVLHHNFDKLGLLGGASYVAFGKGYMTSPIRVLINGRVSTKFAHQSIPVNELLTKWTKDFFRIHLPLINPEKDLEFHFNLSTQSSPGKIYEKESKKSARQKWFEPESLEDLPEFKKLMSNDTSLGVGYAPASLLEIITLEIENSLNSKEFKKEYPWVGSDIKILSFRNKDVFYFTICVPQISQYVKNIGDYINNLGIIKKYLGNLILKKGIKNFELNLNTRDNYELTELYLTAIGSSIESGDEGLAGRGNRVNKIISPTRPMSMEGSCGKNPIYHIGKVYYAAAFDLANKIFNELKIENEVYIASQSGRDLLDPWIVVVNVPDYFNNDLAVKDVVNEQIKKYQNSQG